MPDHKKFDRLAEQRRRRRRRDDIKSPHIYIYIFDRLKKKGKKEEKKSATSNSGFAA